MSIVRTSSPTSAQSLKTYKPIDHLAARYGAKGVENFVSATKTEIQMLTLALCKYKIQDLGSEDLGTLDKELAEMFNIELRIFNIKTNDQNI
ncbi:MAG: hypothetical protein QW128_08190 [Thermoprotei archaeon]